MAAIEWLEVRSTQPTAALREQEKKKPGICRAFCVLE